MVAEITPKAIEGFSGSERILVRDMIAVTLCNLLQDSLKKSKVIIWERLTIFLALTFKVPMLPVWHVFRQHPPRTQTLWTAEEIR